MLFYRDRLGLKDLGDEACGNHLLRTGAGSAIGLTEAEPGAQRAHTVLTFDVENITDEPGTLKVAALASMTTPPRSSRPSTT